MLHFFGSQAFQRTKLLRTSTWKVRVICKLILLTHQYYLYSCCSCFLTVVFAVHSAQECFLQCSRGPTSSFRDCSSVSTFSLCCFHKYFMRERLKPWTKSNTVVRDMITLETSANTLFNYGVQHIHINLTLIHSTFNLGQVLLISRKGSLHKPCIPQP